MRRAAALLLGCALALGASSSARAQSAADVAAARDLFREGTQLSQQSRWDEAIDRFARSLQLKRAPLTLYSLGVAQRNAGHFVDALESFRAFLAEPPTPGAAPYEHPAREAIAELDKQVGRVTLRFSPAPPAGTKVTLDGAPIPEAALDRPRLVDPGEHTIVVEAPGFKHVERTITCAKGQTIALDLPLEPLRSSTPPSLPPPLPPKLPPSGDEAPSAPSRALPIALIAGGGALLVGGVVVGVLGVRQAADAPTRDGPDAEAARVKSLVGDVLGGAGIVSAAVGVVLFVVQPSKAAKPAAPGPSDQPPKPAQAPGVAVTPWIGPTNVGVRLTF